MRFPLLSTPNPRNLHRVLLALGFVFVGGIAQALPERVSVDGADALARLRMNTGGALLHSSSGATAYSMLRATGAQPLMVDGAVMAPVDRAQFFLSVYGAALGMSDPAQQLALQRVSTDAAGSTHVHLDQMHEGLPMFGARLVVHMNATGITGVNGVFVADLHNLSTTPALDITRLRAAALAYAAKFHPNRALRIESGRWLVYPVGLLEGRLRGVRLAYEALVTEASGSGVRERVFIDARSGVTLNRINEVHSLRNREIYTPDQSGPPVYDENATSLIPPGPTDPPLINDPGHNSTDASEFPNDSPQNNLWIFAGGTYALYSNMFGREGYDACDLKGPCNPPVSPGPWPRPNPPPPGQLQKSVYLVNENCPNAYWDGDSTNYCPGFDADDVVSHEWSHAYTQFTHALIYQYQSGALSESYSDIFGETYDLVNHLEGPLGNLTLAEHKYYEEDGSRWVVGEDLSEEAAALLLRDMWKPDDFPASNPGKVSSPNYQCGSGDNGGVHFNSSVPNHAYAMLVDGTTGQGPVGSAPADRNSYNGQSFNGIGMIKAAHIYFQAESNYQTPTTQFYQHADALEASCSDLIGVNLKGPTGALSGQAITKADCAVVHQAMLATEMRLATNCPVLPLVPLLKPNAPGACAGAEDVFTEDWESGDYGWTKTSTGVFADWEDSSRSLRDFTLTSSLPASRTGTAALAPDIPVGEPGGGTCNPGTGDYSGQYTYDSPLIVIPAGPGNLQLRFDHYVATEATFDGGQIEVSVNGGAFRLVPQENYTFNAPNSALDDPPPLGLNTNPNAGEFAWNGTDANTPPGEPAGSWGSTIVDLVDLAAPGDTIKLRFTFSQDGCNGVEGWYVDNIRVYSCPTLEAPALSSGADYENPDTDGSFTLSWTRPTDATGPDLLQSSAASCAPLLTDDAESGIGKWVSTTQGSGGGGWRTSTTKKHGGLNSFWGEIVKGFASASMLTSANPIAIPEGTTKLGYWDFYFNESDDLVIVEVSTDNGSTWEIINQASRGGPREEGAAAVESEPMTQREHDLSPFAGKKIKLRFRIQGGGFVFFFEDPFGWYVDDISITNDNWGDLLTIADTSYTLNNQLNGSRCYRVRTAVMLNGQSFPSPFSNIVNVTVDSTIANLPPVADAGQDVTVRDGAGVTLSGVNSYDPNVETISFAWTQVSGPVVTLADANTASPSFTAPDVTDTALGFRLTVSDPAGLTDSDDITVFVQQVVPPGGNNRLGGALSSLSLLVLSLLGLLHRGGRRPRLH